MLISWLVYTLFSRHTHFIFTSLIGLLKFHNYVKSIVVTLTDCLMEFFSFCVLSHSPANCVISRTIRAQLLDK